MITRTILKKSILVLALGLASAGGVKAGGEPEAKPLTTSHELKMNVASVMEQLKMNEWNLDDALVRVDFVVNTEGDLAVVEVAGENCLVNTFVEQSLQNQNIKVSDHLTNTVHSLTVRYIRL